MFRPRASPRSFYAHHAAAISTAIVLGDSFTLRSAQARLSLTLLTDGV